MQNSTLKNIFYNNFIVRFTPFSYNLQTNTMLFLASVYNTFILT